MDDERGESIEEEVPFMVFAVFVVNHDSQLRFAIIPFLTLKLKLLRVLDYSQFDLDVNRCTRRFKTKPQHLVSSTRPRS